MCQCVYIYVCIVKPDIQTIHRCSHTSIHQYIHTHPHTFIHTHTHTYIHTNMYLSVCLSVCLSIQCPLFNVFPEIQSAMVAVLYLHAGLRHHGGQLLPELDVLPAHHQPAHLLPQGVRLRGIKGKFNKVGSVRFTRNWKSLTLRSLLLTAVSSGLV